MTVMTSFDRTALQHDIKEILEDSYSTWSGAFQVDEATERLGKLFNETIEKKLTMQRALLVKTPSRVKVKHVAAR